MKTVQQECVDMVIGVAQHYSDEKLDREAIWDALTPFLSHIKKDSPGYLNLKAGCEKERKEQE